MRSHVEIDVSMCSPERTLRAVLPLIRHPHEKRDDSGYPDGLKGEAIPDLAQNFQIVPVFDALTNHRHYRRVLTAEQAFDLLA